jgi:HK97 family phage major capsid protein
MKRITEVRNSIAAKQARMQAIFDACEKENRSRNEAETTEWRGLKTEVDNLKSELSDLEEQQRMNVAAAIPVAGSPVNTGISEREAKDFKNFSLVRGLQKLAENQPLDGIEAEVHAIGAKEARDQGLKVSGFAVPAFIGKKEEQRASQTVTGTTSTLGDQGGFTVATEVNQLIEALWAKNFLGVVGAQRFAGLVGNQTFPVQSTKPTGESVTEIGALTDQIINFGKVDMAPNRRGATIPVSKQLLMQSSFDVQKFVIDQIRKSLDYYLNADAKDALLAAIISGNANLLALGTNGVAPTYVDMVALETLLAVADADKDSVKYLTNSKVRGKLKTTQKFASTNGDPVWEKGNEINSYPAVVSNIIPSNLTKGSASGVCSAIILGNFSDLYVGMWGGADFVVDPFTLAKNGEIQITANMFWDVEVARAASFAGIKDALTT